MLPSQLRHVRLSNLRHAKPNAKPDAKPDTAFRCINNNNAKPESKLGGGGGGGASASASTCGSDLFQRSRSRKLVKVVRVIFFLGCDFCNKLSGLLRLRNRPFNLRGTIHPRMHVGSELQHLR